MRDHLSALNDGMDQLVALSRRKGALEESHHPDCDEASG